MMRYYGEQDWAVRRWDRFHEEKTVRPQSFCQFWRTVLLWYSLSRVPFVGKMFLAHLYVAPPTDWNKLEKRNEQRERNVVWMKKWIGTPFLVITWPIRMVLSVLWAGVCTVAAAVDEFVEGRDWSRFRGIAAVLTIISFVLLAGGVLLVLGLYLYLAWKASYIAVLSTMVGIPLTVLIIFLVGPPVWNVISGTAGLVWDIAVVSKHKVCPSIEIAREHTHE